MVPGAPFWVGWRALDRFYRDKSVPSAIGFSEIKRCQHPHFTQNFQNAKKDVEQLRDLVVGHPHDLRLRTPERVAGAEEGVHVRPQEVVDL